MLVSAFVPRTHTQDALENPRDAWHTCLGSLVDGVLYIYALHLQYFVGNTGQTGHDLVLLPEPEFEVPLAEAKLTFIDRKCFQSELVFNLRSSELSLYCCTHDYVACALWHRVLQTNGLHLDNIRPVCVFGGTRCSAPYTRKPKDYFSPAPYMQHSVVACVRCFLENDENRRRETQANLKDLSHSVEHRLTNGNRSSDWRLIASTSVVPNFALADSALHVPCPRNTPGLLNTPDPKPVGTLLANMPTYRDPNMKTFRI